MGKNADKLTDSMPSATNPNVLSYLQEMLIAASKLPTFFTEADLIIKVWESNKTAWGLSGYEEVCPDSNKVRWRMCGVRGLVNTDWILKQGTRYYLSERAKAEVARILEVLGSGGTPAHARDNLKKPVLDKSYDALLCDQVTSVAFANYIMGTQDATTFYHALQFWSLRSHFYNDQVEERLDAIEASHKDAKRCFIRKELLLSSGFSMTPETLEKLKACHAALRLKFYQMFK